ncbi:MAG: GNAT family N-acetyltransferase [Anaerolineae bacterium]|nr:GNAT family N-acetyltransferase [Anaerolineae bacterium]
MPRTARQGLLGKMTPDRNLVVRQATPADQARLVRLIERSARVRIPRRWDATPDAQSVLLAESEARVVGFVSATVHCPPVGVLQGVGLADDWPVAAVLDAIFPLCFDALRKRGAEAAVYVGAEQWLTRPLQERAFTIVNRILTYAKEDGKVPSRGNQLVRVRPAREADLAAAVALDKLVFDPLWCNTISILTKIWAHYPYFVVAELDGQVVGYQFNDLDGEHGHLTRIAVHPNFQGQGIGVRLMAEAMDFFQAVGVKVITLNTQRDNFAARRLYRWFGFHRLDEEALVLRRAL